MRLNLHLLRVFHSVAQEGSFSAAARRLYISQPAVSKAISELERQVDTMLLERAGGKASPGLRLTEAGAALNAHARAIFSLELAAVEELQRRSGLKQGELTIGASTTIASYWLPRYLRVYASRWPDIVLKVVVANTQSIVEDVFDCKIDVALVEGPVHMEGVAHHAWQEERLVIVAPPDFKEVERQSTGRVPQAIPVTKNDLADITWLIREAGSGTLEVSTDRLAKVGVTVRRSMEIGSNEGIARAVAAGLGVALLPVAVVEDLLILGRVVELRLHGMGGLSRSLYRLERQDRPRSPVVHAFLDVITENAV
ncbi:MAG: LysR family transcriptional regulator [Burkholderiaceae bacterium]